jgi:hypothetical protein
MSERKLSSSEQLFLDAWREWGTEGDPISQYKVEGIPGAFDFAFPKCGILIEVAGYGGGHQRPERQAADAAKIRSAQMRGYTVIPITTRCLGSKAKREDLVHDVLSIIGVMGTWDFEETKEE